MEKREITFIRKKALFNNSAAWYIQIDGENYGAIYGGETKKLLLDEERHTLSIIYNDPNIGKVDTVYIPEGKTKPVYYLNLSVTHVRNSFMNYIKIKQL
ncbi:hypothetical protein LI177_00125 [bacterium 210820-DFI.6.37]|nr:hypothetical protein [bacterium 210820-DFI.6.37]